MSAAAIIDEWTRLRLEMMSRCGRRSTNCNWTLWHIYESYTGPLGIGTLTILWARIFGPGIESAERNGWGQWIRADEHGVGMDRTVATGTGYIGQYPAPLAATYESLATCPDDLLLSCIMCRIPIDYTPA